ncbi:MAG: hypothetical protein WBA28_01445, partial [Microbacteriaceae bacterium]
MNKEAPLSGSTPVQASKKQAATKPRRLKPAGKRRLLLSLWASDWQPGVLIGLLIFCLAFMTTLAPRAIDDMFSRELRYSLDTGLVPAQRVLLSSTPGVAPYSQYPNWDSQWGPEMAESQLHSVKGLLELTRETAEETLLSALGAGDSLSFGDEYPLQPRKDMGIMGTKLRFAADPDLSSRIVLREGRMPKNTEELFFENFQAFTMSGGYRINDESFFTRIQEAQLRIGEHPELREPLELLLHETVAERMDWPIGEIRDLDAGTDELVPPVVLVGTFVEAEPEDIYWKFAPNSTNTLYIYDFDKVQYHSALGYLDPAYWSGFAGKSAKLIAWYPLETAGLNTENAAQFSTQLGKFTAQAYPLGSNISGNMMLRFHSVVQKTIDTVLLNSQTSGALIT